MVQGGRFPPLVYFAPFGFYSNTEQRALRAGTTNLGRFSLTQKNPLNPPANAGDLSGCPGGRVRTYVGINPRVLQTRTFDHSVTPGEVILSYFNA